MPRGRILNRSISRSIRVANLSPESALLFTWSIPHLDREGKIYADIPSVKGLIVPHLAYMTEEVIGRCLKEIHDAGLAMIYGDGLFMLFIGFDHNQKIEHHEKASEIPSPSPEDVEEYKHAHACVKLRALSGHCPNIVPPKLKLKPQLKLKKKPEPSAALQAAFRAVFMDGLNIYALMTKIKKQLKQPAGFEFPEEVLLKTCEAYWREKETIRQPWPWFVKVVADEWSRFNVNREVAEGESFKASGASPVIADILKRMKRP